MAALWDSLRDAVDLFDACAVNDIDACNRLLDAGTKPDVYKTTRGSTALIQAAGYGYTQIVQSLLDNGAGASIRNKFGQSALDAARMGGHKEVMSLLPGGSHKFDKVNKAKTPCHICGKVLGAGREGMFCQVCKTCKFCGVTKECFKDGKGLLRKRESACAAKRFDHESKSDSADPRPEKNPEGKPAWEVPRTQLADKKKGSPSAAAMAEAADVASSGAGASDSSKQARQSTAGSTASHRASAESLRNSGSEAGTPKTPTSSAQNAAAKWKNAAAAAKKMEKKVDSSRRGPCKVSESPWLAQRPSTANGAASTSPGGAKGLSLKTRLSAAVETERATARKNASGEDSASSALRTKAKSVPEDPDGAEKAAKEAREAKALEDLAAKLAEQAKEQEAKLAARR